ncbi:MAG: dihydroorotate dehydrogenase-like protein [Acidimicrobiales bacterium]
MDLSTTYMGLALSNPLVASASPLSYTLDGVRRLAAGGVGAVVLHSLFEEELAQEAEQAGALAEAGTESFAESLSYFPDVPGVEAGGRRYLSVLERAVGAVEVPVIASLNGATAGGWAHYARQMESAGAAAIELNIYSAPTGAGGAGREVEQRHLEVLGLVRSAVKVPVAVKLSPYYSSVGEMALHLAGAGADALVLFNRFLHPDIDPEALEVVPGIGLSHPQEGRLARTWIALLRKRLSTALAGSTGVEGPEDVAKYLLAGADVVMTTSSLLRHGPDHARTLLDGLTSWMVRKGFDSVGQVRGLLASPLEPDQASQERAGYVAAIRAANANLSGPW